MVNGSDAALVYALPLVLFLAVLIGLANGIGIGFITWVVMAVARGKAKEVHPLLWIVSGLFLLYFAKEPIEVLFGI